MAAVAQHVRLVDDPGEAADRGADDDADARGIETVHAGVLPGLLRRTERKQHVAVHPPRLLRRGDRRRVEALHLACDPDGKLARVERLDEADAALARDGRTPRRRRVEADRCDRAEPGDGDPSHRQILVSDPRLSGEGVWRRATTVDAPVERARSTTKPRLIFFTSSVSGQCRRVDGLPRAGAAAPAQPRHVPPARRRRERAPRISSIASASSVSPRSSSSKGAWCGHGSSARVAAARSRSSSAPG